MVVIAICGDVGSGKDYLVDKLCNFFSYTKVARIAFADFLKSEMFSMLSKHFGSVGTFSKDILEDRHIKEKYFRRLMHGVGDVVDLFDGNIFIRKALKEISDKAPDIAIFSDFRLKKEFVALEKFCKLNSAQLLIVRVINVDQEQGEPSTHRSDIEYKEIEFDPTFEFTNSPRSPEITQESLEKLVGKIISLKNTQKT